MKMVLQFGFGEVFSWENQEMKQKQNKNHPIFRFKTTKSVRGVFFRISSLHQCGCASVLSTILYLAMCPKPWV